MATHSKKEKHGTMGIPVYQIPGSFILDFYEKHSAFITYILRIFSVESEVLWEKKSLFIRHTSISIQSAS
jgi:hypothetical protein